MKKYILDFICKLEGFKSSIKMLHWDANSLSQHKLCDDIAGIIADYQDKVSEVEQSISGRLPVNNLKGTPYKVTTLKRFVEDVISSTNDFYHKLQKEGDNYIGMRSDTEAVLSDLQRQLYLVDFTIKEGLKERLRNKINENRVTISNGREKYSLTENELREFVSKAIKNVNNSKMLKENVDDNDVKRLSRLLTNLDENSALIAASNLYFCYRMGFNFDGIVDYIEESLNKKDDDIDAWAEDRIDLMANYDDYPV